MRVFRLLVITALTGAALLAATAPAGAAASPRACTTLQRLADNLEDVDVPTDPRDFGDVQETYEDLGKAYKKAAKTAPKQVKKAVSTIGDVYASIGDGNFEGLGSKKLSKAITKYTTYVITACSAS
jgi:hypothetical protein